jgi:5-methylthioadenosine/S-adenosylhomocysteine deaminase
VSVSAEGAEAPVVPSQVVIVEMSTQLVRGRYVVRRWDSQTPVVEDGAVLVDDGVVSAVDRYEALCQLHPASALIGDGSALVMPGFVNAHSHGRGVTTLRQGVSDDPGETRAVDLRLALTADPYWDMLLASINQLEGGITASVHLDTNFGFGPIETYARRVEAGLKAYTDSGIRFSFTMALRPPGLDDWCVSDGFLASIPPEVREEVRAWRRSAAHLDGYLSLCDGLRARFGEVLQVEPVGPAAWTADALAMLHGAATERSIGVQMHLLETPYQRSAALRKFGTSEIGRLADLGVLGPRVTCAHCVWATERDIQTIHEHDVVVAHNPSSNLRLRSGLAPIRAMWAAGVRVGLGTDNLGLNDDEDMLQEVRLAQVLQCAPGLDNPAITPHAALWWATEGGAAAMGRPDLGRLEPGYRADMVVARLDRIMCPAFEDGRDVAAAVVNWLRQEDIDRVIVGGVTLVEHGVYVAGDRTEARRRAYESVRRWSESAGVRATKDAIRAGYAGWSITGEPYHHYQSRS